MKPLLVGLCLYMGCDTAPPPVLFRDVTAQAGIDFVHIDGASGAYFLIETYGAGGGFFDSDGDGDLDVYLVNGFDLGGIQTVPINLDHRRGKTYWVERPDQVRSVGAGSHRLLNVRRRRSADVLPTHCIATRGTAPSPISAGNPGLTTRAMAWAARWPTTTMTATRTCT